MFDKELLLSEWPLPSREEELIKCLFLKNKKKSKKQEEKVRCGKRGVRQMGEMGG